MSSADDVWLCLLLVTLFGLLLFLRVRFPRASKGAETLVLVSATVVFFSLCGIFLKPSTATATQNAPVVHTGRAIQH